MTITPEIDAYHSGLAPADQAICSLLRAQIDAALPEAESKVWHGHPVWFLDGNPVAGYSKQKSGIRLMFWSGADFGEPALNVVGRSSRMPRSSTPKRQQSIGSIYAAGSARPATSSGITRTSSSARACWSD